MLRAAGWLSFVAAAGALVAVALHGASRGPAGEAPPFVRPQSVVFAAQNLIHLFGGTWRFPVAAARGFLVGSSILLALWGIGFGILRGLDPRRRRWPLALERAALAPLMGAVPVSLGVLALGLTGQANSRAYLYYTLLCVLAALPGLWSEWRAWRRLPARARRPGVHAWSVLILITFLLLVPYALSPSAESDELRYHLAAPAQWLESGRIEYLPHQAFSNFPMLGEMLFMDAMAMGGAEAAKFVHLGFLPIMMMLTALLALRLTPAPLRRRGARTGWWAAAGFLAIPTVPILASWGFVDMFMDSFLLAFIYLAGAALARPRQAAASVLGRVAAGAMSIKYTMVPLLALLGLPWAFALAWRGGTLRALRTLLPAVLIAALLAAAWYVKNWYWTGNPVYPLVYSLFDGRDWSAENGAFYQAKTGQKGYPLAISGVAGKLAGLAISPVTTALAPEFFEDNPLGALPLLALITALAWWTSFGFRSRRGPDDLFPCRAGASLNSTRPAEKGSAAAKRGLAVFSADPYPTMTGLGNGGKDCLSPFCGENSGMHPSRARLILWTRWVAAALSLSWVFWFFTYQSNRLLLPTGALALALGAASLARWAAAAPRGCGRAFKVLGVAGIAYGWLYMLTILGGSKSDAIAVGLGFEQPQEYLARHVGYYSEAQWLNRHAHPGERALLVGEYRPMHFRLPVVASDFFDTPQPLPWIRQTPNNDSLIVALRVAGVRYIFFNQGELALYSRDFFQPRFTSAEYQRFLTLWSHPALQIIHQDTRAKITIYEIADPSSAF